MHTIYGYTSTNNMFPKMGSVVGGGFFMNIKIEDIAKVINKAEEINPELLDKVTTVAKEAGINITVKSEDERRVLLLVAELMDRAEETYREQRGLGKDKFNSVLATAIELLVKEGMTILEVIRGVTKFSHRLKTIYNLIK